jgi:hypothetical protein
VEDEMAGPMGGQLAPPAHHHRGRPEQAHCSRRGHTGSANMDGIAPQAESMIPIASYSASCWLLIVRHRFYRLFELTAVNSTNMQQLRAVRLLSVYCDLVCGRNQEYE